MTSSVRISASILGTFAITLLCMLAAITSQSAQAQTLTVLHTFTGERDGHDGAHPMNGLVMDRAGNFYGTTFDGGINGDVGQACFTINDNGGCGTVFKLAKHGSSWVYSLLYQFQAAPDGNFPLVADIGPDGTLYGTTYGGGVTDSQQCTDFFNGCGIAFRLQPPPTFCATPLCPWSETVLHMFTGTNGDGAVPASGDLIFDAAGTLYGTTTVGGASGYGAAYQIKHSQSGWTESVFYSFDPSQQNIANPSSGLIMDQAGNLYGTTDYNFENPDSTVYQLVHGQSGWTANALHTFQCVGGLDGCDPDALSFDPSGNIVFATGGSGFYGTGTVDRLNASNNWSLDLLYTFQRGQGYTASRLTMDAAGNLYGAASGCANGYGCIYKVTPTDNGYVFIDLYEFTGGADGRTPNGPVVIDANGNLYGTTETAGDMSHCLGEGDSGCGTVWELTP